MLYWARLLCCPGRLRIGKLSNNRSAVINIGMTDHFYLGEAGHTTCRELAGYVQNSFDYGKFCVY